MSPIDRELEQALAARAGGLTPPGDLFDGVEREARGIRRRRAAMSGAAALSVLAIAVAVPMAVRGNGNDADGTPAPEFATRPPAASASASASPSTPSDRSFQDLGWDRRGSRGADDALHDRARVTLERSFDPGFGPDQSATKTMWAGPLPDGRVLAVVQTAEVRDGDEKLFVNFYVETASGEDGRIVHRTEVTDRNPQGPPQGKQSQTRLPQVSAFIDGPEDFVVILGAPTTGMIEFASDGRRYTDVELVDGAGLIAVTRGEDRTAYRARVWDGDGVVVYDGPIDLVSED